MLDIGFSCLQPVCHGAVQLLTSAVNSRGEEGTLLNVAIAGLVVQGTWLTSPTCRESNASTGRHILDGSLGVTPVTSKVAAMIPGAVLKGGGRCIRMLGILGPDASYLLRSAIL